MIQRLGSITIARSIFRCLACPSVVLGCYLAFTSARATSSGGEDPHIEDLRTDCRVWRLYFPVAVAHE